MKIRERSENSHFQVSVALLGGGPKIFFSKGVALLRGGSRRSLIPLCILWHRKGQPSVGGRGGCSGRWSGEHTFIYRGA